MNKYVVAIADVFNGIVKQLIVDSESALDAALFCMQLEGWDIDDFVGDLDQFKKWCLAIESPISVVQL